MTAQQSTDNQNEELPHVVQSSKTLIKACIGATMLGVLILMVAILPAEYNIDPTGLGKSFGLTKLANASTPPKPEKLKSENSTREYQEKQTIINVPAGQGVEYKFDVLKGDSLSYAWETEGKNLYFDFHGEPEGDTTGYFQTYTASTASSAQGSVTAPFNGTHGWYWENKSVNDIELLLTTEGNYIEVGIKR